MSQSQCAHFQSFALPSSPSSALVEASTTAAAASTLSYKQMKRFVEQSEINIRLRYYNDTDTGTNNNHYQFYLFIIICCYFSSWCCCRRHRSPACLTSTPHFLIFVIFVSMQVAFSSRLHHSRQSRNFPPRLHFTYLRTTIKWNHYLTIPGRNLRYFQTSFHSTRPR